MLRIYQYYHYQPHRGIVQHVCFGVWTTALAISKTYRLLPATAKEIIESYTGIFSCLQDLKSLYQKAFPKALRFEYSRDHARLPLSNESEADLGILRYVLHPTTHTPNMDPRPQVGVGVLVLDGNGKVIMGQRQGSHGAGKQLPCPADFV